MKAFIETGTVTRHGRPVLRVDDAYVDPVAGDAVVVRGHEVFDLRVEGVDGAVVVTQLQRLRRGPVGGDAAPWVWDLLDRLDGLGLVDDRDDGRDVVEREGSDIRGAIAECAGWVLEVSVYGRVAAAARRLRDEGLAPSLQIDEPLPWVSDGNGGANVPLTALALQLRYLRSSARLSFAAVRWLLCEVIGEDPVPWAGVVESRCGTEEDPACAVAAVNATASLLALATRGDATRLLVPPRGPAAARLSGADHVLRVEEAVQAAMATLGRDSVAEVLARRRPPASFSVAVVVEQCHLSRRIVETILPAMAARLRPSIRDQLFTWFADEVALRAGEEAACRAVGVDAAALDHHLPLPWLQVFVDAYLAVAQVDTGAFLAAAMVVDGAERFGIRGLLARDGDAEPARAHRRARALLGDVPSVSAFRHRSVVESVVLLAEMAERAWQLLLDLHTDTRAARWLPPAYRRRSVPALPGR
jgi:hypothetical protein